MNDWVIEVEPSVTTQRRVTTKEILRHMSDKFGGSITKEKVDEFKSTAKPKPAQPKPAEPVQTKVEPAQPVQPKVEREEQPKPMPAKKKVMPKSDSETETDSEDEVIIVKRTMARGKAVNPRPVYSDLHPRTPSPEPVAYSRYGLKSVPQMPAAQQITNHNPMPQQKVESRYGLKK